MEGWIKLHRKMLDNPIVTKDSDYLAVWIYLLLNATHKAIKIDFDGQVVELQKGQLVTGRKAISKSIKVSESKIQRIIKRYETEQLIEQLTTGRGRLITILNWNQYQNNEQLIEQQVNNNRTTSEQQVNTNKNVKNVKNNIYIKKQGGISFIHWMSENPIRHNESVSSYKDRWKKQNQERIGNG